MWDHIREERRFVDFPVNAPHEQFAKAFAERPSAFKVEEHPDYGLGAPLQPIRLATENPNIGDKVLTAGWGVTGYNEEASDELRSLELTITSTADIWVYTDNYDEEGRLTDTCKGDSGGPLAIRRNGVWEIVGVLFVSLEFLLSSFKYL